jgi:hypothetical protein
MGKIIRVWDGSAWQTVSAALPNALSTDGIQTLTNKTISLANNTVTGTITQFNTALSGADFATLAGSETLTNKDLTGTGNIFPSSLATLTGSQTLTNKTLTNPIISTISNTGTITLPTATDTLVGRATTDTLTNKSLTAPKIYLGYTAKTDNYTVTSGDENYLFTMNASTSKTFSIPTDATYNFPIGTQINFAWITGSGQPSIAAVSSGTTTILSTGSTSSSPKLRVVNSAASAIKLSSNVWLILGDIS